MLYVQRVESTLKKGCNVELGPLTVIVGHNGAGKSTIVQSIELAANGWVSDMEGRSRVKLHTALARLFPEGSARFAKITMSDGTRCSWELEDGAKEGSYKKPEHNPTIHLRWPVQDLMDVLRGDVTTVASWLEQQIVGDLKETQILTALPPAVREIAREFIKRVRKADFMALAKDAKNEAKSLRTQATRTEKTIESMVEGISPPLEDEQRAELEQALSQMTAPVSGISRVDYDAMKADVEGMVEELLNLKNALEALPTATPAIAQAIQKVNGLRTMLRTHAELFGLDECLVCGNQKPDFATSANRVKEATSKLAAHMNAESTRQELTTEYHNVEARLVAKSNNLKNTKVAEAVDDTERRALIARIAADDAARKTWNNADAQRQEVEQLRSRADLLNLAGGAFEKAGKSYLDKCKTDFETTVSQYLPRGERIGVDLESGRFGLERNGELHSALSGAEWSRVLMALAAAQENGKHPAIIVPEDRAWDGATLTRVMESMKNSPVQVIIMATVRPLDVEGWTVVRID